MISSAQAHLDLNNELYHVRELEKNSNAAAVVKRHGLRTARLNTSPYFTNSWGNPNFNLSRMIQVSLSMSFTSFVSVNERRAQTHNLPQRMNAQTSTRAHTRASLRLRVLRSDRRCLKPSINFRPRFFPPDNNGRTWFKRQLALRVPSSRGREESGKLEDWVSFHEKTFGSGKERRAIRRRTSCDQKQRRTSIR